MAANIDAMVHVTCILVSGGVVKTRLQDDQDECDEVRCCVVCYRSLDFVEVG